MYNVVPRKIQQLYLNNERSSLQECILLHSDVTGFTSITESMLAQGKRGAEMLSSIMNRTFSKTIRTIHSFGGEIADFEGDAVFAVFPAERPELALQAARNLHRHFRYSPQTSSRQEASGVSMKISLAAGELEWHILGSDRLCYIFRGSACTRAVRLSASNRTQGLLMDESFSNLVERRMGSRPEELETSFIPEHKFSRERIRKSVAGRFVSEKILSSRLSGEFRTVTPVFFHIAFDDMTDLKIKTEAVLGTSEAYGGELSALYCHEPDYLVGLVLFGAPVSWENNTERAADFSLRMKDELGDSFRAGISRGIAYAGIVGNSSRCRYTVFGDTVNIASRLAHKARFDEILITDFFAAALKLRHGISGSGRWLPRGRSEDILIHRLTRGEKKGIQNSFDGEMLGRKTEIDELQGFLKPLQIGEYSGTAAVLGDPGMGKSRLLYETVHRIDFGAQSYVLKCDDILRKSLNPFVYFLREFFNQGESKDSKSNRKSFDERMNFLKGELGNLGGHAEPLLASLERSRSIIGAMLGLYWTDSVYSKIPSEKRMENNLLALRTLLEALALIEPLILIIEDIQWMDEDSKVVMESITSQSEGIPLAILVSSRYNDDGSVPELPFCKDHAILLKLAGLDDPSVGEMIADRLGRPPDERLKKFIAEHSTGNPFYVEQFCMYLKESGLIQSEHGVYRMTEEKIEIPLGIRSLLVARMDRLPYRMKHLMQTASVLGQEFSTETLALITDTKGERNLIELGENMQLWSKLSDSTFAFKHVLYRDTAYGMLLGRKLLKLHAKAADVLIELHREDPDRAAGEIAIHLMESKQMGRAAEWGWRALCSAMDNYLNNEVLTWADRLCDWIMSRYAPGKRDPLLLDVLLRKDAVLNATGRREEQKANLQLIMRIKDEESWTYRSAEILKSRGTLAWCLGDMDEAFRLFRKGLDYSRRASDESIRGKLLGNLANIHATRGRLNEALEFYSRAMDTHRRLGDRKQEGITLGNLAILYRRMGMDERARQSYEKALKLHRESGNRIGEGRVLCGLGHLEEDPEEAITYYDQALKINREIGDRRNEAIILSNLGRLATCEKDFQGAVGYLRSALSIHREIGNTMGEADTQCLFGEMCYSMENWDNAVDHFSKAISLSRMTGNSRQECIYLGLMGLASFRNGNRSGALECYRNCYDLIMEFQFPPSIDDALVILRKDFIDAGMDEREFPLPSHW